jgi:hypothetical protein
LDFITKRYVNKETDPFNIKTKIFYNYSDSGISKTWEHVCNTTDNNIDGLIFTPVDEPIKIGMIGGGYTLYLNSAIRSILPFKCHRNPTGGLQGWDGNIGYDLHKLGWKLVLDCSTKVEHRTREVKTFLNKKKKELCQTATQA